MGLGLTLLANSRLYEGTVLSVLVLFQLLAWMASRRDRDVRDTIKRVALPCSVVVAIAAAAMGYYNHRLTGSMFRMPYTVHEANYGIAPPFLWQNARPEPDYRHPVIKGFYLLHWNEYLSQNAIPKCKLLVDRFILICSIDFHYSFLPLLMTVGILQCILRNYRILIAALSWGAFTLALLPETWMHAHYAAPAFGLVFVLELQSLRYLRLVRWRGNPTGRFLARWCAVLCVVSLVRSGIILTRLDHAEEWRAQISQRAGVLEGLKQVDGMHLVIVRYTSGHPPDAEWVYNDADIDNAKVVWAREMGPAQNRKLLEYFDDRRAWLLEPDAPIPRLTPYPRTDMDSLRPDLHGAATRSHRTVGRARD